MIDASLTNSYNDKTRYFCKTLQLETAGKNCDFSTAYTTLDTLNNSIYHSKSIEPNRGITSTAITENSGTIGNVFKKENIDTYNVMDGGFSDFFSPECVLMLPLIKL